MPLTSGSLSANGTWESTKTISGLNPGTQNDSQTGTLTLNVASINRQHFETFDLDPSATLSLDFQGAQAVSPLGETDIWTKIQGILLTVDAGYGNVKLEPYNGSNPLTWFFGSATQSITVKAGGFFALGDGSAFTVSGSVKTLKLTNLDASLRAKGRLTFFGGT